MPKIFHHQFNVSEEAVDQNGHVNNVVYVQWMQDVAVMHSDAQGCNNDLYQRLGTTWVARSHYVEYRSPAFAGERIDAMTWIAGHKRSSSVRQYRFVRVSDGKVLARAETEWVYVKAESGRPCAIDSEVLDAFEVVASDEEP
ncbi:MAG: acyl-CoA thioesterase [Desulfuromonadaceae bacterium]|nr:acyl-CoA thioesterase [Desulfuromonadaceae bacterium]